MPRDRRRAAFRALHDRGSEDDGTDEAEDGERGVRQVRAPSAARVTDSEFDGVARETAARLDAAALDVRIAAACRGSGNPAALAWIAEECAVSPATRVVDLGTGLGGPAAWLAHRYGCRPIVLEPAAGATTGSANLFGLTVARADAASTPLRSDAFDLALVLGVLSVVDAPGAIAREAARLAARAGVIEYCSTGTEPVHAGGSTFPTFAALAALLQEEGLEPSAAVEITMSTPPRWAAAQDRYDATDRDAAASRSEREVADAIAEQRLSPWAVVAHRG